MASGYGIHGGPGRCYGLWLDFTKCLADADFPSDCTPFRDDYVECLHHGKEAKRRRAIKEELKRQEKHRLEEKVAAKVAKPEKKPDPS